MNSVDEKDYIHIWDLKKSQLISILNQNRQMSVIKDIQFINNGFTMVIRHKEGITLWNIKQTLPNLYILRGINGISELFISKNKEHLIYCNEYNQIVKANLFDNTLSSHITSHDSNIMDMTIFGDGDVLLKSDVYLSILPTSLYNLEDYDENKPYSYTITLLDLSQYQQKSNETMIKYSSMDFRKKKKFIKRLSIKVYNESKVVKQSGKFVLFEGKDDISSYNITCNKGLECPFVFENNELIKNDLFYSDITSDCVFKGTLCVGTKTGVCYQIDFKLNQKGQLTTSKLVKTFTQNNLTRMNTLEMNLAGSTLINSEITNNDEQLLKSKNEVHDYKRFLNEYIEIIITDNFTLSDFIRNKFIIYAKYFGLDDWAQVGFELESSESLPDSNYFKIYKKNKINSLFKNFEFYFAGKAGIGIVYFVKKNKRLVLSTFLEKNISDPSSISYSEELKMFMIPLNNSIEFWNHNLTIFVHKLRFDSEILKTYLIDSKDHKRLLIYEQTNYHEIDLLTLEFLRQHKLIKSRDKKRKGFVIPLNLGLLESNKSYPFPFFRGGVSNINLITFIEGFNLFTFPFINILDCFSKHNYKKSIKNYAEYYFTKISKFEYKDFIYGPLNPLNMVIYQNDMILLENLLEQYRYPKEIIGYYSPLTFAFINNLNSAVRIICEHLLKQDYSVIFSRLDFQYLIKSNKRFCHDLISSIPIHLNGNKFPMFVNMPKKVELYKSKSHLEVLSMIKAKENKNQIKFNKLVDEKKNINKQIKKSVDVIEIQSFKIPFTYSYHIGNLDSLELLDNLSYSKSNKFITSIWSNIVHQKWNQMYLVFVIKAILFFLFILSSILPVFFQGHPNYNEHFLRFTNMYLSIWGILFIYSILEIISYSFFNIKK